MAGRKLTLLSSGSTLQFSQQAGEWIVVYASGHTVSVAKNPNAALTLLEQEPTTIDKLPGFPIDIVISAAERSKLPRYQAQAAYWQAALAGQYVFVGDFCD